MTAISILTRLCKASLNYESTRQCCTKDKAEPKGPNANLRKFSASLLTLLSFSNAALLSLTSVAQALILDNAAQLS